MRQKNECMKEKYMSKDEKDKSKIVNKEEANKKAIKLMQSAQGIFFKNLEEVGFPIDLLLDDDQNSILSKLYEKAGGEINQLNELRSMYQEYQMSSLKEKSIENIISDIGEDVFQIYEDFLTLPHLIKAGFAYFDQQRKSYIQDEEKRKPFNHFLALSVNGLLIYKFLSNKKTLIDSLLYFRFQEFPLQMYWLLYSISSGAIHPAIRELRFILESWTRGYYVDQKNPNLTLLDKKEKQEGLKFKNYYSGKKIIREGSVNLLPDSIKKSSINLWSKLNEYSHPDPKELERIEKLSSENIHEALFNYGRPAQEIAFNFLSDLMVIFLELSGFDSLLKKQNLDWHRNLMEEYDDIPVLRKISKSLEDKRG